MISILLLATTVRSFAHMPLGISDRNNGYLFWSDGEYEDTSIDNFARGMKVRLRWPFGAYVGKNITFYAA